MFKRLIKEREIFTEIIKIIKSKLLKKEKRKNEQIKEKVQRYSKNSY